MIYRAFLELPDQLRREGGAPLPRGDATPCEIAFDHVQFSYAGSERAHAARSRFQVPARREDRARRLKRRGKTTCMKLLCGLYSRRRGRFGSTA